jgi:hypothetical protein
MAATTSETKDTFVTVPAGRRAEVARTLAEPVPQPLSLLDQFGLWGNLGVSLLGFTGAIFVLQPYGAGTPGLSLAAALAAIVVGTLLGTLAVALVGLPGARTGAPSMVLLRGLFGARLSYLPTARNIFQCVGWGVFALVTTHRGTPWKTRPNGAADRWGRQRLLTTSHWEPSGSCAACDRRRARRHDLPACPAAPAAPATFTHGTCRATGGD